MRIFVQVLVVCTITMNCAFAQNYKVIEWDIVGLTRIIPTSNTTSNTIGFYTEARINLNNKLSIGLKYENQLFKEYFGESVRGAGISTSLTITSDYYLYNKINNRVFVGATIGSYNNSAITESGIDVGGKGPGISPRIGYEYSMLRITGEYNYTFKNDFPNYLGLKFAVNIGGRHRGI